MEKLKDIPNIPKIIVITGNPDLLSQSLKRNLPILCTFTKPFNIEELIYRLKDIQNEILNESRNIKNEVSELLSNFSFNTTSLGYAYIIDCISICIENKYSTIPTSKLLYSEVAGKNNISNVFSIKWNIDKSIKSMINLTSQEKMKEFFQHLERPTSKLFINRMLDVFYK